MTPRRRHPLALFVVLNLLLAAALACALPGVPVATSTPDAASAGALGQFDCTGFEGGLGAYTGRLTLTAPAEVRFTPGPGGSDATGTFTFDAAGNTFTFAGGFVFDSAIYDHNTDGLVATVAPGVELAHAEGGTVSCVRAEPGITGP